VGYLAPTTIWINMPQGCVIAGLLKVAGELEIVMGKKHSRNVQGQTVDGALRVVRGRGKYEC
jgi:hypothetical protein